MLKVTIELSTVERKDLHQLVFPGSPNEPPMTMLDCIRADLMAAINDSDGLQTHGVWMVHSDMCVITQTEEVPDAANPLD